LVEVPLESWEETECPLCQQGIPINTAVGKGATYLAAKAGRQENEATDEATD
jgi:hypothetical protein